MALTVLEALEREYRDCARVYPFTLSRKWRVICGCSCNGILFMVGQYVVSPKFVSGELNGFIIYKARWGVRGFEQILGGN